MHWERIAHDTKRLRDHLLLLDPDTTPADRVAYDILRNHYIRKWEGVDYKACSDDGNVTVGVGFNMDASGADRIWKDAFSDHVSFSDVYCGKTTLTAEQIDRLLSQTLRIREAFLRRTYHHVWPNLKANERLAIESANYNAPSLVRGDEPQGLPSTRFYGHIKDYVHTKNIEDLKQAVFELKECSNSKSPKKFRQGLQNRRNCEACLLASYESPMFQKERK